MGEKTGIAWTHHTVNFWIGCDQVSPGCAHCYAKTLTERWGKDFSVLRRTSDATFYAALKWKEPALIFTCSMSDFFHEDADQWRDGAWDVIRTTPHLTWQILTKRPERILEHLPVDWGERGWPNVWIGTSVENQHFADIRIPLLRQVPAVVRFLSCEPLLGPLKLHDHLIEICPSWQKPMKEGEFCHDCGDNLGIIRPIHWVIVGGESGPKFRTMNLQWARDIRDDCKYAHVAFFYKQSSAFKPGQDATLDGVEYHQFPSELPQQVLLEKVG